MSCYLKILLNLEVRMKILILALSLMSSSLLAQEVIEVSCESPNLNYLNRFELNEKIDFDTDAPVTQLEDVNLRLLLTKRGNDSRSAWTELNDLEGEFKKVESDFTSEPYYSLTLKDEKNEAFVQLNIGFPMILNSLVRTADGYVYKSGCSAL